MLFFLACAICLHVRCQLPGTVYTHFDRHNFLASSRVNCVLQDSRSFMWLATDNGIQRYDYSRWIWLKHDKNDVNALPDNNVLSLLEDSHQRLWVLTASGVCLLNRNNFHFTPVKIAWAKNRSFFNLRAIVQLKDGLIWLELWEGGLYRYDEETATFVADTIVSPKTRSVIFQMVFDRTNKLYWLSTDKGVMQYNTVTRQLSGVGHNPDSLPIFNFPPAANENLAIHLNDAGQLWVSNWEINYCYDTHRGKIIFCDSSKSDISAVMGYYTDSVGVTWGFGGDIVRMNLATGNKEPVKRTLGSLYGIDFETGNHFMEDNEHSYWLATTSGVYVYNRFHQQFFLHKIRSYLSGETLKPAEVSGFLELADSSIIAFTWGNEGYYYFDKHMNALPRKFDVSRKSSKDNRFFHAWCGVQDKEGHIWIGCQAGALLKLYPETGRVEKIRDSIFNGSPITCATKDNMGNLWFGTYRNLVVRRDAVSGKFSCVMPTPVYEKGYNAIFQLLYDDGFLWAATSDAGLLKINARTLKLEKQYRHEAGKRPSFPAYSINDLIKTSANQLMMATPVGIVVMDKAAERFTLLDTDDGLPSNNVSTLIQADKRTVWFVSSSGISRLNLEGNKVTNFGLIEGLTNEVFFRGSKCLLRDGKILFGGAEGFTSFDPRKFSDENSSQDVRITCVKLFDKYLDVDSVLADKKGMVLNYQQNFLTIEFSGMSFLKRYKTEYYYQLEGIDKDWVKADEKQQAAYTSLPGGSYTFNVRCKTNGSAILGRVTSLKVRIIGVFWKQWWFYALCLLALASGTCLFLYSGFRRRKESEKVRTRIAKDLHDEMGSTLSTINILSEMAKMKIDSDIPTARKFIHQISDSSSRIMESMDDIVWNIDTANDGIENILSRMREFAGSILEARGVNYTFREDEQIRHMNLELGMRHDLLMIFKEAVNNLAKYSGCRTVSIDVSLRKGVLCLSIADDGQGFEHDQLADGNGLMNMRQRAAALKGTLSIRSGMNRGTTVELCIPV